MFLEQEYRSREELKMLILESMRRADEETRRQAEAEGMAQGKAERNRAITRTMTAAHYPISEIARLLSLSEDDVRGLLVDQEQP